MKLDEYVVFVIEHRCNSKCDICFIEGDADQLVDLKKVPLAYFQKFLKLVPKDKGIVFSGGEVTLNEELPQYAAYAREKGFRDIMIQTNARALSSLRKAKELKSAGINRFFVSFHAADHALSDKITGKAGAHAQTLRGLENLQELGLTVYTNTVMSSMNYMFLPQIGEFLQRFNNIPGMHFWGYIPVTVKAPELVLPYEAAAPYLNRTIQFLLSRGKEVCVKSFPVCLLDDAHKKCYNKGQPDPFGLIDHFVESRFDACNFRHYPCCEGTGCMGLPEIYTTSRVLWRPRPS